METRVTEGLGPPWQIADRYLTGADEIKTVLLLVSRLMSMPVVNKTNRFILHPRVRLFSIFHVFLLRNNAKEYEQIMIFLVKEISFS